MKFTYSTYNQTQIKRIMTLEELKTQGGAIAILDMRSREAQKIRRDRARRAENERVANLYDCYSTAT